MPFQRQKAKSYRKKFALKFLSSSSTSHFSKLDIMGDTHTTPMALEKLASAYQQMQNQFNSAQLYSTKSLMLLVVNCKLLGLHEAKEARLIQWKNMNSKLDNSHEQIHR